MHCVRKRRSIWLHMKRKYWQDIAADITNVAVVEKFRKKGVATELLEQLFLRGYERGIENFTLEVRVGNAPAIHLYEKLGFERSGIRPNFYEKPKEDALIMWKYVNH